MATRSNSSTVPPLRRGYLRKQARGGMIKNWQTRYFVLNQGKIQYFEEKLDRFPYGDKLKGELSLNQATITYEKQKLTEKQIYILGANGEKDLLLEAESPMEVSEWKDAIQKHIDYFTLGNADLGALNNTNSNSITPRHPNPMDRNNSWDNSGGTPSEIGNQAPSQQQSQQLQQQSSDMLVTPTPSFVIKVLRAASGEKIFINLFEANEVPFISLPPLLTATLSYNKWPFMIITQARTLVDEAGGKEVSIYDAIVHPQVNSICAKNQEAKDAMCSRVLRLLKKQYGEDLQEEYKLPKISKRYKGDTIQQVLVPANIAITAKTRSSIHVQAIPSQKMAENSLSAAKRRASLLSGGGAGGGGGGGQGGGLERKATETETYGTGIMQRSNTIEVTPNQQSVTRSGISPLTRQITEPINYSNNNNNSNARHTMAGPGAGATAGGGGGGGGRPGVAGTGTGAGAQFLARRSETEWNNNIDNNNTYNNTAANRGGNRPAPMVHSNTTMMSSLFHHVDDDPSKRNSSRLLLGQPGTTSSPLRGGGGAGGASANTQQTAGYAPLQQTAGTVGTAAVLPAHFAIPYIILRANGTVAKSRPEKLSTGKVLGHGQKVYVVARRVLAENLTSDATRRSSLGGALLGGGIGGPGYGAGGPGYGTGGSGIGPGNGPSGSGSGPGIAWLRTTEGWIPEKVYGGSVYRVLEPKLTGQPSSCKVVATRFEDIGSGLPGGTGGGAGVGGGGSGGTGLRGSYSGRATRHSSSGWLKFSTSALTSGTSSGGNDPYFPEPFQTRFTLDIHQIETSSLLRISRTFTEIINLRKTLLSFPDKALKDRAGKASLDGFSGIEEDGLDELVADIHLLLEVIDSVETWLTRLFSMVNVEKCKCKAFIDFLTPKESDIHLMEMSLMAKNGLQGGWPEVEIELEEMMLPPPSGGGGMIDGAGTSSYI